MPRVADGPIAVGRHVLELHRPFAALDEQQPAGADATAVREDVDRLVHLAVELDDRARPEARGAADRQLSPPELGPDPQRHVAQHARAERVGAAGSTIRTVRVAHRESIRSRISTARRSPLRPGRVRWIATFSAYSVPPLAHGPSRTRSPGRSASTSSTARSFEPTSARSSTVTSRSVAATASPIRASARAAVLS